MAIWDGTPARGPGGTADVVHRALAQDVPVLWIHAEDPATWGLAALLDDASAGAGGVVIRERSPAMIGLVTEIVSLPANVASEDERDAADDAAALSDDDDGDPNPVLDYLAPMRPPRTGRLFAALTALAALERPGTSGGAEHEDGANGTGLARLWQMPPSIPKEIVDQIERRIGAYYASADALGERFGDLYRNTFSWMYLLSPFAVLCALLAYFGRELAGASIPSIVWPLCGVAELAILVAIVHLYRQAHVWRFHERWIDYRTLAERLRHLAVLWPLGCPPRDARAGSATSHDERRFAWIDWYTRAVVREAGLFGAPLDAATLAHYRTLLFDRLIDEQVAYHAQVAARMERVYHNLHGLAKLLFGLSLLAALVHVLLDIASREAPAALHAALVIVAIVGPAVGAAVHGFLGQGDFWNLARRSARARAGLEALRQELRSGSEKTPLSSRALGYWAERAVETLQEEVATWRVFTRLRRITLG
jgi:hypothetical protein